MHLLLFESRFSTTVEAVVISVTNGVTNDVPVGVPVGIRNTVGRRGRLGLLHLRVSNILPRHPSPHDRIPVNEEGLRKVLLDSDCLVVDVVVVSVVAEEKLERVEREGVPAMIVDCLKRGKSEEEDILSR